MFELYFADFNLGASFKLDFFMLKIFLTKLLLLLLFSPSFSLAYNSMCYSPVQLSAFLSKPKKSAGVSQSSVSRIKANIRKLEKALDTAEGDLQDSLDKDKLKAKPSFVAGKIRDYIEDEQDGWDCAKGLQSLFFFPSVIPQAYAIEDNGSGDDDTFVQELNQLGENVFGSGNSNAIDKEKSTDTGGVKIPKGEPEKSADTGGVKIPEAEPEKSADTGEVKIPEAEPKKSANTGKVKTPEAEPKKSTNRGTVTIPKAEPELTPEEKCEKSGRNWNTQATECCSSGETVYRGKCVSLSEKKCLQSGGEWKNGPCECPNNKPQLDNGFCKACPESKPRFAGGACRSCIGNTKWDSTKRRCVAPPAPAVTEQKKCEKSGRRWNPQATKCCPKGKIVHEGKCVSLPEKKCLQSDGEWNNGPCECPNNKPRLDNGFCKACPADKPVFKDGQCKETPQQKCKKQGLIYDSAQDICITKAQRSCKASGGTWDNSKGCICPNNKPRLDNGSCKACPDSKPRFAGGACRSCIGNTKWDSTKRRCVAPPEPALTEKQKCEKSGQNWNVQAKKCCPKGKIVHEEKCVSLTEKKCLKNGGEWKNGSCKCPDNKPKLANGSCKACPPGHSFRKGSCVPCPDWKKHKAFKSKGKVSSSFCDEYAKDKRKCKRALSHLQRRAKQLNKLMDQLETLEDKLLEAQLNPKEQSATEASGLCFDCLKRVINASKPSAGQVIGQSLGVLAGAGFSIAGYNIGKNAQTNANMLRIQQGSPSLYDGFSLTGMGMGYPFMANSLYGLARTNAPVGGWSCSPSVSPYGQAYSQGYGYGHNMRYY